MMDPATLFRGKLDSSLLETMRHLYMGGLRKYMLMGQGDIKRYLMDFFEGELL